MGARPFCLPHRHTLAWGPPHRCLGSAGNAPAVTRSSLTIEWGGPWDLYHKPRPPAPCSSTRTTMPALHTQPKDPHLPAPVYTDTLSTAPQLCVLPEATLSSLVSRSHSTLAQQVPKGTPTRPGSARVSERGANTTQRSIGSTWRSPMPDLFSRAHALNPASREAPAQSSGIPGQRCCDHLYGTCPPASCSLQAAARLHTSALREVADAAEESRTIHLLVQPRKELFCRPCRRMDQAQRQSWEEVQPLTSAAAPHPLPSTPYPSCSPGDRGPRTEERSFFLAFFLAFLSGLASLTRGKEPRDCNKALGFLDKKAKQNTK